MIGNLNNCF